ncbi:MAG: ribonuclease III [Proteobacteria bacterium]|nr:ribonuclease III [Pseudomonadota bacterium]
MSEAARVLQTRLGYVFKDESLLLAALTHPSREKSGKKVSAYERLEFLGDRVLSLVIAEWLFEVFAEESEGQLAKRHAGLVNRDALASIAENMDLAQALQLVSSSDLSRGKVNILSDALEALIGAIWTDGGPASFSVLRRFIRREWQPHLNEDSAAPQDAKSALQEWAQARGLPLPVYKVTRQSGPAHAPHYVVRVEVEGHGSAEAEGASKREAEKKAATGMMEKLAGK